MSSCVHCMGGRAGAWACSSSRAAGQQRLQCRVVFGWYVRLAWLGNWHYTRFPPHPNRAIYFFLWDSPPRGLPGYSSPPAHGWGRFHQPRLRAATQGQGRASRAVAAAAAPARVGTLSGWRRSVLCLRDAMRCGARAGIEAIFRAACGRGYSRTWTQRIFGSLRRRLNHDDELSIYMHKRSDFFS